MNITEEIIWITKDWLYYSFKKDGKRERIKKPNNLTPEKIRAQIEEIEFEKYYQSLGSKEETTNEKLEKKSIPLFVPIFYSELIKNEILTTPQEMNDIYFTRYCEKSPNSKPNLDLYRIKPQHMKDGWFFSFAPEHLAGRMCRAFNSYVREVELFARLSQRKDIEVIYSSKWDTKKSVDILVKYNNCLVGIACCQDSERSDEYYIRKHSNDEIPIYKFAISKKNSIVVGDTWLYSDEAVENLIKTIKEDIDKKIKGEDKNE
jgi:hypothetical protein